MLNLWFTVVNQRKLFRTRVPGPRRARGAAFHFGVETARGQNGARSWSRPELSYGPAELEPLRLLELTLQSRVQGGLANVVRGVTDCCQRTS